MRVGLQTSDDFRFLRLWWEVNICDLLSDKEASTQDEFRSLSSEKRWVPFSKGGEYSPYYSDLPLVLNWKNDGEELKRWVVENASDPTTTHWSRNIRSHFYYFTPGLSYLSRTSVRLCSVPFPVGSIFSHVGPAIFVPTDQLYGSLARLNSLVLEGILSLFRSRGTEGDDQTKIYESNIMQRIPWPIRQSEHIAALSKSVVNNLMKCFSTDETTHVFNTPFVNTDGCRNGAISGIETIERMVAMEYNISDEDVRGLVDDEVVVRDTRLAIENGLNVCSPVITEKELQKRTMSYCVGCAFGRWDVRLANRDLQELNLPDPFGSLPVCSPGMLQEPR